MPVSQIFLVNLHQQLQNNMRDNFQTGHGSVEDIVTAPLSRLLYRKDYIAYQRGQSVYVCPEIGLSPLLAANKNHPKI